MIILSLRHELVQIHREIWLSLGNLIKNKKEAILWIFFPDWFCLVKLSIENNQIKINTEVFVFHLCSLFPKWNIRRFSSVHLLLAFWVDNSLRELKMDLLLPVSVRHFLFLIFHCLCVYNYPLDSFCLPEIHCF